MSKLNPERAVLLTGAGGQLGMDVSAALRVRALNTLNLRREGLDVTDKDAVQRAITEAAPAVLINCSAYTKVDMAETEQKQAFAVNETGAANLAAACQKTGTLLIHISTDFVFDGTKTVPYKEEEPTNPLGVYGKSKLAGEEAIRELCPPHIIIRTSWLYGTHGGNFVKTMLRLAGERETLQVVSDQRGTPTWSADLARVIAVIAEAVKEGKTPASGIYHYSDAGTASWFEFALAIVEEARGLGKTLKCKSVKPIPTSAYPTPAPRPAYSVLDTTKIKDTLKLDIPKWRRSLIKMLTELSQEEGW